MSDFKLKMFTGETFDLTVDEKKRLETKIRTTGGINPFGVMKDGSTIFFKFIVGFFVDEYEEPSREMQKTVSHKNVFQEDTGDSELEEKRANALNELLAKSSCKHDEKIIYYQAVTTSKGETSLRYFPVCGFCGQRFRYVKAEDLTDEQKEQATGWIET